MNISFLRVTLLSGVNVGTGCIKCWCWMFCRWGKESAVPEPWFHQPARCVLHPLIRPRGDIPYNHHRTNP